MERSLRSSGAGIRLPRVIGPGYQHCGALILAKRPSVWNCVSRCGHYRGLYRHCFLFTPTFSQAIAARILRFGIIFWSVYRTSGNSVCLPRFNYSPGFCAPSAILLWSPGAAHLADLKDALFRSFVKQVYRPRLLAFTNLVASRQDRGRIHLQKRNKACKTAEREIALFTEKLSAGRSFYFLSCAHDPVFIAARHTGSLSGRGCRRLFFLQRSPCVYYCQADAGISREKPGAVQPGTSGRVYGKAAFFFLSITFPLYGGDGPTHLRGDN